MRKANNGETDRSTDHSGSEATQIYSPFQNDVTVGKYSIDEIVQTLTNALNDLDLAANARTQLSDERIDLNEAVQYYKISLIKWALRKCRGKQNQAAKMLSLKLTTLNTIIRKYEIEI